MAGCRSLADWLAILADPTKPFIGRGSVLTKLVGDTTLAVADACLRGWPITPALRRRVAMAAAVLSTYPPAFEDEIPSTTTDFVLTTRYGDRYEGACAVTASPRAAVVSLRMAGRHGDSSPLSAKVGFTDGMEIEVFYRRNGLYLTKLDSIPRYFQFDGGAVMCACRDGEILPMDMNNRFLRRRCAAAMALEAVRTTTGDDPILLERRPYVRPEDRRSGCRSTVHVDPLLVGVFDERLADLARHRSRAVRLYALARRRHLRSAFERNPDEVIRMPWPSWMPKVSDPSPDDLRERVGGDEDIADGAPSDRLRELAVRALHRLWYDGLLIGVVLRFPDGRFAGGRFTTTWKWEGRRCLHLTVPSLGTWVRNWPAPLFIEVNEWAGGRKPRSWGWVRMSHGLFVAFDRHEARVFVDTEGFEVPISVLLAAVPTEAERIVLSPAFGDMDVVVHSLLRDRSETCPIVRRKTYDGLPVDRRLLDRLCAGTEIVREVDFPASAN